MAKTTRQTEGPATEKQPAARRARAAAPAAGAKKTTTRSRKKAETVEAVRATAERGAANLGRPLRAAASPFEPTHDEIALRAWRIYESRGGGHGQAMDDWLEAKRQLFAERGLAE